MSYHQYLTRTGAFAPRRTSAPSPRPLSTSAAPSKAAPVARTAKPSGAANKARLAALAAKVDKLSTRLAAAAENEIKPRLGKLEERVDRLENGHTMGPRTGGAEYRLYKLEKRVDSLEGREATEPEKIASADELPGRVDALEARVEALEKRASDKRALEARMGLHKPKGQITRQGNTVVFGTMTPEDARAALAARGKARP